MALHLGPPNWRGDIKWEENPAQTKAPLPSSTLQSYFHPHFPFFSFLLPPGAASQPSRSLISVAPADSGGLRSFVLFAPSAEKNPAVPSPLRPAAPPAILPPKKGRAKPLPPHADVQTNQTQDGVFLFCEGFAQKAPWRARPQRGARAGTRGEGGKRLIRASPGQDKAAGSSPGFQSGFLSRLPERVPLRASRAGSSPGFQSGFLSGLPEPVPLRASRASSRSLRPASFLSLVGFPHICNPGGMP